MQLTSFTDYGLRALMFLAALPKGERSNIQAVSDRFSISKNHVIKIIHKLSQLNYVTAVRGKNGGITLARPLKDINIGQVIRDLEPLEIINCDVSACHMTSACRLKLRLAEAKLAFLATLDECTLADLMDGNDEILPFLIPIKSLS